MRIGAALGDMELLADDLKEVELLNGRFNGLPEEKATVPFYRLWSITGHPRFFIGQPPLSNTVVVQEPAKTFPLAVSINTKLRIVFFEPEEYQPEISAAIEERSENNAMGQEVWRAGEHEWGKLRWHEDAYWYLLITYQRNASEKALIEYVANHVLPPREDWVL